MMVSSRNMVVTKTIAVILHQLASAFVSVNKVRSQLLAIIHKKETVDHMIRIYLKKRSLYRRHLEEAVIRKMRIKKSYWVMPGRTDQWWQNMLNGQLPDENWKHFGFLFTLVSHCSYINYNRLPT